MTAAAPRRRLSRADRREQLVATAERVLVARGAAASMEDVADEAGVTKPVLYDHFGSKDGLLAAVIRSAGERMLEVTAAAARSAASPEDALRLGLVAYFRFVDAHTGAWSLLLHDVAPGSLAAAAAEEVRGRQVADMSELIAVQLPRADRASAQLYAEAVSGAAERLAAVRIDG